VGGRCTGAKAAGDEQDVDGVGWKGTGARRRVEVGGECCRGKDGLGE
jgi:hypothetical protein